MAASVSAASGWRGILGNYQSKSEWCEKIGAVGSVAIFAIAACGLDIAACVSQTTRTGNLPSEG